MVTTKFRDIFFPPIFRCCHLHMYFLPKFTNTPTCGRRKSEKCKKKMRNQFAFSCCFFWQFFSFFSEKKKMSVCSTCGCRKSLKKRKTKKDRGFGRDPVAHGSSGLERCALRSWRACTWVISHLCAVYWDSSGMSPGSSPRACLGGTTPVDVLMSQITCKWLVSLNDWYPSMIGIPSSDALVHLLLPLLYIATHVTRDCVTSNMKVLHHIWMRHVTYELVMSHGMRHVTGQNVTSHVNAPSVISSCDRAGVYSVLQCVAVCTVWWCVAVYSSVHCVVVCCSVLQHTPFRCTPTKRTNGSLLAVCCSV